MAGLVMLVSGTLWLLSDSVSCGGSEMRSGDECVTYSDGESTTLDLAGQRRAEQFKGGALALFGAVLTLTGGLLVRSDRGKDPSAPVDDRINLGRRDGWSFTDVDTDLLTTWRHQVHFSSGPAAWSVLSGIQDGVRFVIFDYRLGDSPRTAWMVFPNEPSPEFRKWALSRGIGARGPLNTVEEDERALIGTGRLFRSKKPDHVLRPLTRLVEAVRRYERETASHT
ncbi:hypothetical protein Q0Z83_000680 [Actinoplanes sichuanensis]|uniref:hypothetical protein n=1 Tax=Actinoplanes sichuanensis TaxID=512349 RepID=UPI0029556886|nr:hypothetical protein [Actinoplanes sichuanensis]BEL01877.1 hypothetical protein Q0Z83_000680 [Actinoplanes sichuanensis]